MAQQKTILVTGGAGFIGSHLCERLVKDGHRVISLDNYFTGTKENHVPGVEYREGHTKDIEKLVPETPDIIFHLGEYARVHKSIEEPELVWDMNIIGTLAVLEFWRKQKCKLVYTASSTKSEISKSASGIAGRDLAPYTWAKASNVDLVNNYGAWYRIPYAVTYFHNVYGPRERAWGDYGTVVETFRQNYLAGKPHHVNTPGTQTRAFTHVFDTVSALILIAEKGEGDGYTICAKDVHSIIDVAKMFGGEIEMRPQTKMSRSSTADDSTKLKALGWKQTRHLKDYIEEIKGKKMTKKILIFSLAYYPSHVSGAETAIKDTTDRIDPNDIEFHLITLHFDTTIPKEEKIGNVQVHRVGFGGAYISKILFVPLAAFKACSLERKVGINAVWCMMTYALFPLVLARLIGLRAPHILSLQDGDPYEKVFHRWFILPLTPLLDYGFKTATIIQAISGYLAEWPRKRGYQGPVEIIYDGANPRDLKDDVDPQEIERLKQELGKKEGEVFLINTARLVHQKGNDITIRALPLLPEHVRLVLVGGGEEEAMLRELAQDLGVMDRVIFTGQVDRSIVTLYRKAGDIFVGPSRSEGQGHAFNSAMASYLPVVATQVGGIAEFLYDKKRNPGAQTTGWAVDPDNPEQIAEAVKDILAHPEEVKKVTETARALMLEKFDWDAIAIQMRERVFAKVL